MTNNTTTNEEDGPSISSMVDDFLAKYELNESAESVRDKISKNIETNKAVLRHTAKNFAMGKITEKNMYDSLSKVLNTTPETTRNIVKDIKSTLAPFIKNVEANRPKDEGQQVVASPQSSSPVASKKPSITKKIEEIQTPEKKLQPKGPDNYREPIE